MRRLIREANSQFDAEVIGQLPTDDASRQFINRLKSSNENYGPNSSSRIEIIIPRAFKFTISGQKFYLDDSDDEDRIMIFSTNENLEIMSRYKDWLCRNQWLFFPSVSKLVKENRVVRFE